MKQIAPNYTYNKTTGVITLTGVNIDRDQLLLIVNTTRNVTYYNFADSATTLQAFTQGANTSLTLNSSVITASSAHANGDALTIYYDDQAISDMNLDSDGNLLVALQPAAAGSYAQPISGTVNVDNVLYGLQDGDGATFGIDRDFPVSGSVGVYGYENISGGGKQISVNTSGAVYSVLLAAIPPGTNSIGAVTAVDLGAKADAVATTDTGTFSVIAFIKRGLQNWTSLLAKIPALVSGRIPVDGSGVTQPVSLAAAPTTPVTGTFWQTTQPVSGSVTALSSTGTITTRSSTITTGGTSQQVAASNSSRKYFVIQNISDTAMYLGVGYTPTTTTGLLLSANGGGMIFETSFIPTQAINVLCATTGKAFVAWEG
jgi:hypothetical protein